MNHKFDELTKSMAQSVTRRAALKKFGVGLAGVVLATLGLTNKAEAVTVCNCRQGPPFGCKTQSCIRYCRITCPQIGH